MKHSSLFMRGGASGPGTRMRGGALQAKWLAWAVEIGNTNLAVDFTIK
jgi:hypothetical protein